MARFGDYINIQTGKLDANASSEDGQYPFFTCSVNSLRIDTYSYDCECALVAGNGDLNVKYYNGKFNAYQRTYIIESKDKNILSVPYLYYFLDRYVEELRKQSIGGVIKYIKIGNLTEARIPMRSILEQGVVVVNLKKVNDLKTLRKQQLSKLDELVKSRFVEMFGSELEQGRWPMTTVGSVAKVCVGVVIKPTQYYQKKGVRAFRSLNIGEMCVKDSDWVFFSENGHSKNQKSVVHKDDVLVVRSGAPGTACVVPERFDGANAVDIIIARPDTSSVDPTFLAMFTNMPHGRNQIKNQIGGAAQQHYNVGGYKSLNIIAPPLALQREFAVFVAKVDKLAFKAKASLEKLETLKKAMMQKYFN